MFFTMSRKSMINVRLGEKTHEDFKIVAELRGASMSTLLHQFIVKAIREEKEISPKKFIELKPLETIPVESTKLDEEKPIKKRKVG